MKKLFLLFTLIAGICCQMAAQVSFKVQPPRNVIAGNVFYVTYRLSNAEGTSLNAPAIEGCKLLSRNPGVSTMQSMQIINGVQSSNTSVDYTFTYRAEKEGTYTIPSATIVADGKTLQTSAAQFRILPPDRNSAQNNGGYGGNAMGMPDFDEPAQDTKISKNDIFVRVILNKSQAHEGEAIECTLKL